MATYPTEVICLSCENGRIVIEVTRRLLRHDSPLVYKLSSVASCHPEYNILVYCNFCESIFRAVHGKPSEIERCIELEKQAELQSPQTLTHATEQIMRGLKILETTPEIKGEYDPEIEGC